MHYYTFFKLRIVILLGFLLSCFAAEAQNPVPFTARKNLNVRGDVTMIGNNIVNRKSNAYNTWIGWNYVHIPAMEPNDPYPKGLEPGNSANDGFNMRYINVDPANTFSSSKATLTIPDLDCSKVAYAALYWSATYKANNADGSGGRSNDFNVIKFKRPGDASYTTITGTKIFDGLGTAFDANSPYVCYADVTALLQAMTGPTGPNGEYTVADIRATQGKISGGVSGGWNLFVVYENPEMSGKYITSFDGFAGVSASEPAVPVDYSGFQTVPAPLPVDAKLAVAALEGDKQIEGDQLRFKSGSNAFQNLSNGKNPWNNVFNASITTLNNANVPQDFTARVPNSLNTLGYDADIIKIPDGYLPNSATSATLELTSTQDTYYMFFNALCVDIITPEITLLKTVEDLGGEDLGGQDVQRGDKLVYVVTFENKGKDNATDLVITDKLPENTYYEDIDLEDAPGADADYDEDTRTVSITIPNELVLKEGQSMSHEIKIIVRVAASCNELTDHCANVIENTAYATYRGQQNTAWVNGQESAYKPGDCGETIKGPANFLVDVDDCTYTRNETLCGASITLEAGDGYMAYEWYKENGASDIYLGDTQTMTVTAPGQYYVKNIPTAPCIGLTETINVSLANDLSAINPVAAFADKTPICPNNGTVMPNISLCGKNDSRFIASGVSVGTVTWQKLDTDACKATCAACMEGPRDCAHNAPECAAHWHEVAAGPDYTVNEGGEYRLVINHNGCTAWYYFNVYKIDMDPKVDKKDIFCTTPGEISVVNVPTDYEYRLINQTTGVQLVPTPPAPTPSNPNSVSYGAASDFTIATPGVYKVELRQVNSVDGCIYELPDIGIMKRDINVTVLTTNKTCTEDGSIRIQVLNVKKQYYYTIESGGTVINHGPVDQNNYLLEGLNPGTYDVTVTTDDGCTHSTTATINDYSNPVLNATVTQHISCDPGYITLTPSGGQEPYTYAIYSKNGTALNPGFGDFTVITPFEVVEDDAGTYVFIAKDATGCAQAISNPVTINYLPVTYNSAKQDVSCNGANDGRITFSNVVTHGFAVAFDLIDASDTVIATNGAGTFENLAPGSYTVNIVVQTDVNSCTTPVTFSITEPAVLTGTAGITQILTCTNGGGRIAVNVPSVTGGTAPYTYSINGTTFGTATTFTGLGAGTYKVTIRDARGCTHQTAPMTITTPPAVTDFTISAPPITCPTRRTTVTVGTPTGGTAPYTYSITAPAASAVNNGNNNVFAPIPSGVYTFRVTDANGCYFEKNITIAPISIINVTGQNVNNVRCRGTATGAITFTVTNFGASYNYTVTNTGAGSTPIPSATGVTTGTLDFTNLAAGSYKIYVENTTTGCFKEATVTIAAPAAPLAMSATVTQPTCTETGSVTATATGGWGSNRYSLTNLAGTVNLGPQTASTFSNLAVGTYTISVTDSNGCVVSSNFTLTNPPAVIASVSGTSSLCYDADGATIIIATTGGTAPFTYKMGSNPAQSSNTFNNLAPGTYTFTVTDSKNCTSIIPSVIINQPLLAPVTFDKALDCSASPEAEITVNISGGAAPYKYEVKIGSGAFSAPDDVTGTSITYSAATANDYQFRITDAAGCIVTTSTTTVPPLSQPSITSLIPTHILCHGANTGAITVNIDNTTGTAPYTINVARGVTNLGTQTTGLTAGTYTVTITDSKDCTATQNVTINEPAAIAYDIDTVDISCDTTSTPTGISYGKIIIKDVVGGVAPYTYYVRNNFGDILPSVPAPTGADHTFNIINYGIYEVEVVDANGCSEIEGGIIIASPPDDLTITVNSAISDCATGGTIKVEVKATVGSGNYRFGILTQNNSPFVANPATDYKNADAGTPFIATFNNLIPGVVYTFVVWDATTNCYFFKQASAPVPTNSAMTVSTPVVQNVSCSGSANGNVSINISNYSPGTTSIEYTIYKTPSNIAVGTATSVPVTGTTTAINNIGTLPPGDYMVLIKEFGGTNNGCSVASSKFTITQSAALLQASAAVTKNDNCGTDAGVITANGKFGTAPYEYQLLLASATAPTVATWAGSTNNIFNTEAGAYIVYVKDAYNCIQQASVTLNADPSPVIDLDLTDPCVAQGAFTITASVTNGVAPYAFRLGTTGAFVAGTTATYSNLPSGTYQITVRDANGCTDAENITIYAPLLVTPTVTAQPTCTFGGTITATGTGGSGSANFEYELQTAGGTVVTAAQPSGVFTNVAPGSYKVIITDTATSCTAEASVSLETAIPVAFTTAKTDTSCNAGTDGTITVTLDPTNTEGPYRYSYTPASTGIIFDNQSNPLFTGLGADTYTVTVTSAKNCTETATVTVGEPTPVAIDSVTAPEFACAPDNTVSATTLTINASGGTAPYTYSINNGVSYFSSNTFTIVKNAANTDQTFAISVLDGNGCEQTTNFTINRIPEINSVIATRVSANTANCKDPEVVGVTITGDSDRYSIQMLPSGSVITLPVGVKYYEFTIASPGAYTFRVVDLITDCRRNSAAYNIAPFDTIDAVASAATPVTCYTDTNGTVTVQVNGYTGAFDYEVLNGATQVATGTGDTAVENPFTISGLSSGNLIVRVTATGTPFCTADTAVFTIDSPADPLTLTVSQTAAVTCDITPRGEILAIGTGGWGTRQFELINNTTSTTLQNYAANNVWTELTAGSYTINMRDIKGCIVSQNITLDAAIPIDADITTTVSAVVCNGDKSGTVQATGVSGGSGAYLYVLNTYNAAGTAIAYSSAPQASPIFTNLGAGIYTITVVDGWECDFETEKATITQPAPLVGYLSVSDPLSCLTDAELTATASGGTAPYQYSLTETGPYSTTNVFNVAGAGTYRYWVKDANNCKAVRTNAVTILPVAPVELKLDLDAAKISCAGGSNAVINADAVKGMGNYQYTLFDGSMAPLEGPSPNANFDNLGPGNYYVRVTSGDCEDTSSVIPIANPAPLASNPVIDHVVCFGQANGRITLNSFGGTAPIKYAISPNLNQFVDSNVFSGLSANDEPGDDPYTVIVQDANGCFLTFNLIVTQPQPITAVVENVTDETCLGEGDGTVEVTIDGGTGVYVYSIDSDEFGQGGTYHAVTSNPFIIRGLPAGSSWINIKDSNDCFLSPAIDQEILPGVNLIPTVAVTPTCSSNTPDNTVVISINSGITAANMTYSLDDITYVVSGTFTNVGLAPGTYTAYARHTIAATATKGEVVCTKEVSFTIDDHDPIAATAAITQTVDCNGDATGEITITTTSGTGPFEYAIGPAFTYVSTNEFGGLEAGTYDFKVRDDIGCEFDITGVSITEPDALSASETHTHEICMGAEDGTIEITIEDGTAPYEVILNGGTPVAVTGTSILFEDLAADTYTIQVIDDKGCTFTVPAVTINAGVDIQATADVDEVCTSNVPGSVVTISVNPAVAANVQYALDVNDPANFGASNTFNFTSAQAGPHTVYVKHTNGCTVEVNFTINNLVPITASVDTVTNVLCYGASTGAVTLTASNGTGDLEYAVGPAFTYQPSATFTGLAAGTYDFRVRDEIGCVVDIPGITITQPAAALSATATSTDEICINDDDGSIEVTITGGTAPYQVRWNGGAYTTAAASPISITGLADGTYTIEVRDDNGCTFTLPTDVTINEGVEIQGDYQIYPDCTNNVIGNVVFITVNPNLDPDDFEYSLDGDTYDIESAFFNLADGNHTVDIQYANGCVQRVSFTIDALTPITATAAVTEPILCHGDATGEITVTANDGTGTLSYAISDQASPVFDPSMYGPSNVFGNLTAGTYTISIMDDNLGCEMQLTQIITEPTPLTASATHTDEICINANDGEIDITITGGTAPYETRLNGGTFAAQTSYPNLADGTYTIEVRDDNGCTFTLPAAITVTPGVDMQPVATVTPTCVANTPNNDVTIAINPAVTAADVSYSIDGLNYQPSNTFSDVSLAAGTYTAYAQHLNGCIQTTTFTIVNRTAIAATATVTADVLCYGQGTGVITITATAGTAPLEYAVGPAFTYVSSNVFNNLAAGTYDFKVRDAIGCEFDITGITVTEPALALGATASHTDEICINANDGEIDITITGGTAPYETRLNGGTFAAQTSYTNLADGIYTIEVRDDNGCTFTLPATITVAPGVDMQPAATVTPTCVANTPNNDVTIAINPAVTAADVSYSIDGLNYQPSNTFSDVSLAAGTYTAYAQHLNGCIQTTTFTIVNRTAIAATAAVTADVLCYGQSTGVVTITATAGTAPLEYAVGPAFTYQPSNVFNNLAAGTYDFKVRDAIGCEFDITGITVTEPALALGATATHTDEICINANDGEIDITITGGTAPYETRLNGGTFATQTNYPNLADGTYTIEVRDDNGCTFTLPATITVAPGVDMQPAATVTPTCASNAPNNDVTIAINPAVTGADVSYSIDGLNYQPSNTFSDVSLAAGTYTAYAQHLNGCIQTTTFTIVNRTAIAATAAVTADVLCYGQSTGVVTITATAGTAPLEYAVGPAFTYVSSNVFNNLAAGMYDFKVRDAIGCEFDITGITVTEPALALGATATHTDEICINANDGEIDITITGGTAPYETRLNGGTFAAQTSYTNLADGTYTIEVRDDNGCTFTLPTDVTINEGVDIQGDYQIYPDCTNNVIGNVVFITVNPNLDPDDFEYSLDGDAYDIESAFFNLADGNHTVDIRYTNGCVETVNFTIDTLTPISATSAVTEPVFCFGETTGEITITATGGTGTLSYAISNQTPPVFGTYQVSPVFVGLAAGNYTISIMDDNVGCETQLTQLITQPVAALSASATHTDEICINANDGEIDITITGGTAPYETRLNGGVFAAQTNYPNLADGTYTIEVRDDNGCTFTLPATITVAPGVDMQPVASVTPTCASNAPNNDVTIAINPAVTAADVSYSIDGLNYQPSNTFSDVSLAAGTYTAYAQHLNGCIQTTTFTIVNRTAIAATAAVTADVLCYGQNTGVVTITATGGTTPLEYAVGPTFTYVSSNVFNNLAAGTYDFKVRDAIGCEFDITGITVTQPTAALSASASHTDEICINANDGEIDITITGGTAPYETRLNGGTFAAQTSYTNLADGTYTIEVRDDNGCTFTLPATITVAPGVDMQPAATVTPTCVSNAPNNDVTIAINPAVTAADVSYSIDGLNYQPSNTFSDVSLAAGTYTAYAQHLNGCIQTATFTIVNRTAIAATAAVTADVLCYGQSTGVVTITATAGTAPLEYAVGPAFTYQPSNVFNNLAAGTYDFKVRDAIGCEFDITGITVIQPAAALSASASHTDEICINANDGEIDITITGGTAPYETRLNGGTFAAQTSYTGLADGTYTIEVRDDNGCTFTLPAAITVAPGVDMQPVATVTPTCVANTPNNDVTIAINPAVTAADVSYSIDGLNYQPSNTFSDVSLAAGTYTAYAQHLNGCIQTTTFTIVNRTAIAATAAVTADVLCYGQSTGVVTITATAGTAPLEYAIIGPAFTYVSSNVFNNLAAGTYDFKVRDAIGCEFDITGITVTQPVAALSASATYTDEICINANDGEIDITITGGTAPYETRLNGGTFAAQTSYTNLADGTYTIEVRDDNGCTFTLPAAITVAPGVDMQPAATVTPTCVANTPNNDVTIAINPAVTAADVSYSIDGLNYQPSNTFSDVSLAAGTYTAYAQHLNGCIQTTTFTIVNRTAIAATAAVTADVLCYGQSTGVVTITATAGTAPLEYAVGPTFTYVSSNVFNNLAAGTYDFKVRDAIGCEFDITGITVTEPALALGATATHTDEICINANDGEIDITITGGTAPYETRLNGGTFAAQTSYTGLADGTYTVEIRDGNGCTFTLPATITVAPGVDIQAVADIDESCTANVPGTSVTINVNAALASAVQYALDADIPANYQAANVFSFTSAQAGPHTVYVKHTNGCTVEVDFTINNLVPVSGTAAATADVQCFGNNTGEITITPNGGTETLEYAMAPDFNYQSSNVFSGLAAGTYDFKVRDAIGCEFDITGVVVTGPSAAITADIDKSDEQCLNAGDGAIIISNIAGGTVPYQTRINPTMAFVNQTDYINLADGTYNVEVRDANGCIFAEQVIIATGVQIQPTAAVTQVCDEATIVVTVNQSVANQVMYSLDGVTYQASNTFANVTLPPGSHQVYVQHSVGCTESAPFTIAPSNPIVVGYAKNDIACFGTDTGNVQINATGGTGTLQYAVTWNITPVPVYSAQTYYDELIEGTYTIWVKDAMGCVAQQQFTIEAPDTLLTLTATATPETCVAAHDGTITIVPQGGTAPYSTALGSPINFQEGVLTYNNLFGGTYEVFVRDANGCYVKTTVKVDNGVNLNPFIQTVLSCDNNNPVTTVTVLLSSPVQNVTYRIPGVQENYLPNNTFNLAPGNYTAYVQHINGCNDSVNFTVQPRPAITASATTVAATCYGTPNGSINVTASGGSGALRFGISPDYIMTPGRAFNNVMGGDYLIRIEDAYGCHIEIPVTVGQPDEIVVSAIDVLQEICDGDDNGAIEIGITGGTAPYAASLNANGPFADGQTLFDGLSGGTSYTIYVRDANGCTANLTVPMDVPAIINAKAEVLYECEYNTITIITEGNVLPQDLVYTLTGPKGNTPQTSNVFANLENGTYTVEVLHTSGCTDNVTFAIERAPDLVLSLSESGLNQFTATVSGGKGPYRFELNGNDMGTRNTFTYTESGTYLIKVTDSMNCTREATITVKFVDIIIPDVMSPEGNGQNDTWSPGNTQNYPNIATDIFDRYGRKLATLRQGQTWDGTYDGNPMPTGDYWFLIKLNDAEGREFVGHFTIYR